MTEGQKAKYLTKRVKFGEREVILYSLDGATWSTRRDELQIIRERQEAQRITLSDIKDDDERIDSGYDYEAEEEVPLEGATRKTGAKSEEEVDVEEEAVLDDVLEDSDEAEVVKREKGVKASAVSSKKVVGRKAPAPVGKGHGRKKQVDPAKGRAKPAPKASHVKQKTSPKKGKVPAKARRPAKKK